MKTLHIGLFFLTLMIISCNTPKKLVEKQAYNQAIDKLLPKVSGDNVKEDNVNLLKTAFHSSNQIDHGRVMELRSSGQADVWPEIYRRLSNIQTRQEILKPLSAEVKSAIGYVELDLDDEIAVSKVKAEQYLGAEVKRLLQNQSREDAQKALKLVRHLEKINPNYPNLHELRFQAILKSSENVWIKMENPLQLPIPKGFTAEVLNFNRKEIDQTLINYDVVPVDGKRYDLIVKITLDSINVTPERIQTVTFEEKKDVVTAKVTEKNLSKIAKLNGKINFCNKSGAILYSIPYEVLSTFVYNFATIQGDKSACSEQTLALVEKKPIPFPKDESLLIDAAKKLNQIVRASIWK